MRTLDIILLTIGTFFFIMGILKFIWALKPVKTSPTENTDKVNTLAIKLVSDCALERQFYASYFLIMSLNTITPIQGIDKIKLIRKQHPECTFFNDKKLCFNCLADKGEKLNSNNLKQ